MEMSSSLHAFQREQVMRRASAGEVKVLVSSDQMARGIDLSNIRLVINYDPPTHARTYVHRVGRTARANQTGHAITMLKIGQSGMFKKLRSEIARNATQETLLRCKIQSEAENEITAVYKRGLKTLAKILELEKQGTVGCGEEIIL